GGSSDLLVGGPGMDTYDFTYHEVASAMVIDTANGFRLLLDPINTQLDSNNDGFLADADALVSLLDTNFEGVTKQSLRVEITNVRGELGRQWDGFVTLFNMTSVPVDVVNLS
ncbi:hypothetical protein, partial [Geminicoccus flavidas]|uniref:hypothetical protein n=1 Tax=Geminicoccus flavidas TaxID=2506407 RepID=UPI00135AF5E0